MQFVIRIALSTFLLTLAAASTYHSSAKLRRDGVLNLYPFPRVGRAAQQTWDFPDNDLYLDSEPAMKRQLYAFPRVGRSELYPSKQLNLPLILEEILLGRSRSHGNVKRESESKESHGMWFGPRVGRSFRSEEDDIPQNIRDRSEPELLEPDQGERNKRQTN